LKPESPVADHSRTADVAADGSFEIKDIFPDRYRVEVETLPTNGFIKTVRLNGTPARGRILDLTNGFGDGKLRITLSANGGHVTGWVTDEKDGSPSSSGAVVIFPDQEDAPDVSDWCDARQCEVPLFSEGRYGFGGLRPGRYRLLTTPEFFSSIGEIKDFVKQNRGHAEVVHIKQEGDKISKDLKMPAEDADETKK